MEVLTRDIVDEIMDAILPADVVDDEVPSSFTIVGHVGKCISCFVLIDFFTETDSISSS
jgi:hypothetical protein